MPVRAIGYFFVILITLTGTKVHSENCAKNRRNQKYLNNLLSFSGCDIVNRQLNTSVKMMDLMMIRDDCKKSLKILDENGHNYYLFYLFQTMKISQLISIFRWYKMLRQLR